MNPVILSSAVAAHLLCVLDVVDEQTNAQTSFNRIERWPHFNRNGGVHLYAVHLIYSVINARV